MGFLKELGPLYFYLREARFMVVKVGSRLLLFKSPERERLLGELFAVADSPISLNELARRAGTWRRQHRWIVDAVSRECVEHVCFA